uniref:Uncharacterized protein n=1 Tax=Athene cunicularia TaxID=194338 RepID=A0A663N7T3_ATHCN
YSSRRGCTEAAVGSQERRGQHRGQGHICTGVLAGPTTGLCHVKKLLLGVWFAPPSKTPRGVKQSNSAIQRCVRVQLIRDGRKIMDGAPRAAAEATPRTAPLPPCPPPF